MLSGSLVTVTAGYFWLLRRLSLSLAHIVSLSPSLFVSISPPSHHRKRFTRSHISSLSPSDTVSGRKKKKSKAMSTRVKGFFFSPRFFLDGHGHFLILPTWERATLMADWQNAQSDAAKPIGGDEPCEPTNRDRRKRACFHVVATSWNQMSWQMPDSKCKICVDSCMWTNTNTWRTFIN